jgi:hypothetical protein
MSWVITGTQKEPAGDPFFFSNVSLLLHGDGTNDSTVIRDSSSRMNTVTAVGNARISTAQSKFGGASIAFDGNNDWLSLSNAALALGSGDFTVECFVRWAGDTITGITASSNVIDFRTAEPSSQFYVLIRASAVSEPQTFQYFVNGAARITSTTTATLNTWRHIAVAKSSATTTMYVDGVSQGTWADSTNYTSTTATIGGRFAAISGDQRSLNGYIDDLRITKGVARYTANFTPPTAPFPDLSPTMRLAFP